MVKHSSSDVKEEIKLHNGSSYWPEKTCNFHQQHAVSGPLQASNLPASLFLPSLCCCVQLYSLDLQLFLHPKYIWSAQSLVSCNAFNPFEISLCPWWFTYWIFGLQSNSIPKKIKPTPLGIATAPILATTLLPHKELLSIFKQSDSLIITGCLVFDCMGEVHVIQPSQSVDFDKSANKKHPIMYLRRPMIAELKHETVSTQRVLHTHQAYCCI